MVNLGIGTAFILFALVRMRKQVAAWFLLLKLYLSKLDVKTSYITFILLPMLTTMLALSLSFTGGSQAKIGILDKDKSQVSKQFVSQLKHNKSIRYILG